MRLPTYQESKQAMLDENGSPTLLDEFIYNCSPAGYREQSEFRWYLQRLLESLPRPVRIDSQSRFYYNCQKRRKEMAKICDDCPFREQIEEAEERDELPMREKYDEDDWRIGGER